MLAGTIKETVCTHPFIPPSIVCLKASIEQTLRLLVTLSFVRTTLARVPRGATRAFDDALTRRAMPNPKNHPVAATVVRNTTHSRRSSACCDNRSDAMSCCHRGRKKNRHYRYQQAAMVSVTRPAKTCDGIVDATRVLASGVHTRMYSRPVATAWPSSYR